MHGVVRIRGLKADAIIGCYDWERTLKQPLVIDLELTTNFSAPASSDALDDALDYAALSEAIVRFVERSEFQLLEALSVAMVAEIFARWDVMQVRVDIDKPGAVSLAAGVGVSFTASRDDFSLGFPYAS